MGVVTAYSYPARAWHALGIGRGHAPCATAYSLHLSIHPRPSSRSRVSLLMSTLEQHSTGSLQLEPRAIPGYFIVLIEQAKVISKNYTLSVVVSDVIDRPTVRN